MVSPDSNLIIKEGIWTLDPAPSSAIIKYSDFSFFISTMIPNLPPMSSIFWILFTNVQFPLSTIINKGLIESPKTISSAKSSFLKARQPS